MQDFVHAIFHCVSYQILKQQLAKSPQLIEQEGLGPTTGFIKCTSRCRNDPNRAMHEKSARAICMF